MRIYEFPNNGTVIDLKKVNSIGAIDKQLSGEVFIPVYFERAIRPVKYIIGHSIGETPEPYKLRMFAQFQELINAYKQFKESEK